MVAEANKEPVMAKSNSNARSSKEPKPQPVPYGTKVGSQSQIAEQFQGEEPVKLDGTPDKRFQDNGQGQVNDNEHDMRLKENKTPAKIREEAERRTSGSSSR